MRCPGSRANESTSAAADPLVQDRGFQITPDIRANAGGVTISCFECVQSRVGYFCSSECVNTRHAEMMREAFGTVYASEEE